MELPLPWLSSARLTLCFCPKFGMETVPVEQIVAFWKPSVPLLSPFHHEGLGDTISQWDILTILTSDSASLPSRSRVKC